MYHAIITNLTTLPIMMESNIMRIRPIRSAPLPPMPTYPPPRLYKIDEDDRDEYASEEYASEEYASEEYASEEEDEEEQLMQINCPSLQMLIEINKTQRSLNVNINEEYKYSIVLYPSLTFQDVYDSILIHFPELNELKFKLKWHENMEDDVSNIRVSSKQFMKIPIDKLPLSRGEIVDKKIHKCNLCRTESIHITQKCSACQKVYYCSASCQKLNWPYHKTNCS